MFFTFSFGTDILNCKLRPLLLLIATVSLPIQDVDGNVRVKFSNFGMSFTCKGNDKPFKFRTPLYFL